MSMFSLQGPISYGLMGLILAVTLFIGWNTLQRQLFLSTPLSEIFTSDVIVPNFNVGSNPQVQYDRIIKQSFNGSFHVEVKEAMTGRTICMGSGSNLLYAKDEPVPSDTSIKWYVNDDCALRIPAGQYYLETSYVVQIEGMPNRYLTVRSNVFTVSQPQS